MEILWRITKLAAKDRLNMIGSWVALLLATGFFLTLPYLIGDAVDRALPADGSPPATSNELLTIGAWIVGVITLRGFFNFWNLYLA